MFFIKKTKILNDEFDGKSSKLGETKEYYKPPQNLKKK